MHVRFYPKSIAMSAWRQSNVCFAAESGLQAGFSCYSRRCRDLSDVVECDPPGINQITSRLRSAL
jgi:hypothetical protein